MQRIVPRLVIGGANSGAGKTSVTLAVTAALRRRGLRVQTFKVGPDFLDPGHLTAVSGRPCYNLDGWMCTRDYVEALFARTTADADIAVIEGVMGLFDGAAMDSLEGSTAQMAAWLGAPVILVVNTHGMAGSLAALVNGFAGFEPEVRVAGVIANQCGSAAHATGLAAALAARPALPPLVGGVLRGGLPQMAGRHLGLVSADPQGRIDAALLEQWAAGAEAHIDLERLIALARQAPPLNAGQPPPPPPPPATMRLAVARDRAFHFYYQDFFDELALRGCEIRFFSPLTDHALPNDCDALYLGGGYPEVHADQLAANLPMLESIRAFAASDRPVFAEGGGLIYLSRGVYSLENQYHALLGLLPAATRMRAQKKFLGYSQVELNAGCLLGEPGATLRGHAFHYSELVEDPPAHSGWRAAYTVYRRRGGGATPEGYLRANLLAGYLHLHLAGQPATLDHFISFCRRKVTHHAS